MPGTALLQLGKPSRLNCSTQNEAITLPQIIAPRTDSDVISPA